MTDREIIQSYSMDKHAGLKYRAYYLRERGYKAEANEAEAEAEAYWKNYLNALNRQAGLPEVA